MRRFSMLCGATLAAIAGLALAQTAAAQTAPAHYTTTTTPLATLMADPAAKAVLAKDAPDLAKAGPDLEQANGMTLTEISSALKAYAPNLLPPKVLAQLDEDFAKIPAKN